MAHETWAEVQGLFLSCLGCNGFFRHGIQKFSFSSMG